MKKDESNSPLPIFTITKIELTKPIAPLPPSNNESLLCAIEQANDELEEDEEIRGLALKILAAFKKQNSVEAISQIALYDLSANLRSKAVSILAQFNHESVFETILLAGADPSREVRAAAALGLFHLSFDRTEAWLRLAELDEIGRVRQGARAVIAGDLVQRSLGRLIHLNKQYASEAFAIVVLLIKAGETSEIFASLCKNGDINIKKAILHIIKITNEPNTLAKVCSMLDKPEITNEMRREINKILETNLI